MKKKDEALLEKSVQFLINNFELREAFQTPFQGSKYKSSLLLMENDFRVGECIEVLNSKIGYIGYKKYGIKRFVIDQSSKVKLMPVKDGNCQ